MGLTCSVDKAFKHLRQVGHLTAHAPDERAIIMASRDGCILGPFAGDAHSVRRLSRRHAVTRTRWWGASILMSVTVLSLDIATGPYILFPITFVIPVGLGTWFLSRTVGVAFALALVLARFAIALLVEPSGAPLYATALNAAIRLLVLIGFAVLLAKVNRQQQALAHRVQVLEGILPICSFCKKIRRPDGVWEQIEVYISHRSATQFSHGFCEACGREHYGEALCLPRDDSPETLGAA